MYYAGIGSRRTPDDILAVMEELAGVLEESVFTLRSGGANGADAAFAKGCERKEIYLPWSGYNGFTADSVKMYRPLREAYRIARDYHPNWLNCSSGTRKMHARNAYIILGESLTVDDAVKFVVCWTPNGKEVGGTAMGIKIAKTYGIPVFNLADDGALFLLQKHVSDIIRKD